MLITIILILLFFVVLDMGNPEKYDKKNVRNKSLVNQFECFW